MLIPEILERHARAGSTKRAITVGPDSITYSELYNGGSRVAAILRNAGVSAGTNVVVLADNSFDAAFAFVAIWHLGATPVPLSQRLTDPELDSIIALAQPSLVLSRNRHLDSTANVLTSWSPGAVGPIPHCERPAPAWKTLASGGSTGRPKLIVSEQSTDIDPAIGSAMGIGADDIALIPGPLYHSSPFTYSAYTLLAGGELVLMERFSPAMALQIIAEHRISWTCVVPTMMNRMLRCIREEGPRDMTSLRNFWHMASPCAPWLKEAWIELLGSDVVMELYGSTEGQEVTIISGTEWLAHRGSVGRPRGAGEFAIFDDGDHQVPAGKHGRIFVRGGDRARPSYHYVGSPPAESIGDWETVGDLGWKDQEGYLYIDDRQVDLIVRGGANVYPAEVEHAIESHPAVAGCVVVGLPDNDLGTTVHATVCTTDGLTEDELVDFLSNILESHKIPSSVAFVDEILRDDAGKVRRSEIRQRAVEEQKVRSQKVET